MPLLRGLGAYGAGEIAVRLARIGAIVVIAHRISPALMGVAALASSLFELIRVLANAGIGQRIIAAEHTALASTCRTALRLFWAWCGLVALVQLVGAFVLATLFRQVDAAAMLAVLAGVYLFMPGGLVQVFLLMREGRMTATARIATAQVLSEHLLSLMLVVVWPSAWALILPKLLTAPIWLIGVRRAMPWRPDATAPLLPLSHFSGFGAGVLGTELAVAARSQCDNLLIAALLGTQALGLYFFAFGAGLGITTSFVNALSIVLLPYFCGTSDEAERRVRLRTGLLLALGLFLPVTLAQVSLAPIYVPLVFGERWAGATTLVSVLGMGAIPMIFGAVKTAWLRAIGATHRDAGVTLLSTIAALAALAATAHLGLEMAATAYVAALWFVLIPASLHAMAAPRRQKLPSFLQEITA